MLLGKFSGLYYEGIKFHDIVTTSLGTLTLIGLVVIHKHRKIYLITIYKKLSTSSLELYIMHMPGDVVELVDTLGLEPSAARRGGSTPSIPTT